MEDSDTRLRSFFLLLIANAESLRIPLSSRKVRLHLKTSERVGVNRDEVLKNTNSSWFHKVVFANLNESSKRWESDQLFFCSYLYQVCELLVGLALRVFHNEECIPRKKKPCTALIQRKYNDRNWAENRHRVTSKGDSIMIVFQRFGKTPLQLYHLRWQGVNALRVYQIPFFILYTLLL